VSLEQTVNVLKKVEQVATLAGLRGVIDEESMAFLVRFELDNARRQMVYVRFAGMTKGDQEVINFSSPCLQVKKGFLSGISKEQALDLLRRNEKNLIARYGIRDFGGESVIVASVDHFLETMDPSEFGASAFCVALAADLYEREHGQDKF
jgi:hypothetical protein